MDRYLTSIPLKKSRLGGPEGTSSSGSMKRPRGDATASADGEEVDSKRSEVDDDESPRLTSFFSSGAGATKGSSNSSSSSGKAAVQMYLDLGQKSFGRTRSCVRCGMVVVQGAPEDEKRHAAFCAAASSDLVKLVNESNCKLLSEEDDIKILEYTGGRDGDGSSRAKQGPSSSSSPYSRALAIVCRALGTPYEPLPGTVRVFFAVKNENIIGFLSTETVNGPDLTWLHAGEETSNVEIQTVVDAKDSNSKRRTTISNATSSDVPEVALGVRQIWTHPSARCRGVASALVDAARRCFLLGSALRRELVAFSQPSADGTRFAFAYTRKSDRVLTYSHVHQR